MDARNDWEGEYDDGGPWSNVQYRKNRKSKGDGIEWTFLVQNVSDRVTRSVLWRSFQPCGFISDAYVARKRDSRGRCFGFVRFKGIEDMKDFLGKLNKIRMFDMKVSVSLAKYDKDHKKIIYAPEHLGRSVWRPKENHQGNCYQPAGGVNSDRNFVKDHRPDIGKSGPSFVQEGRSFADLLRGNKEVHGNGAKVITVEGKGSLYPIHCIGRSIIGCTKEVLSARRVRSTLDGVGLSEVGLSYVHGQTFMLTFNDKASAMRCMDSHSVFFQNNFSKFYLWNGEDIPFSRIAKISITGVPFVIRDNTLFDKIGDSFGTVIKPSSFSWQQEDNSSGTVTVLTNHLSRIEEGVVIKWNEKTMVVWVSEYIDLSSQHSDDDSSLSDSESELVSDSDSDSGEDMADVEDVEEGEIRSPVPTVEARQNYGEIPVPVEVEAGRSGEAKEYPVGNGKSQGGVGSPAPQQSPTVMASMGNNDVHGEFNKSARGECNYEEVLDGVTCPELMEHMHNGPKASGHSEPNSNIDRIDVNKVSGPKELNGKSNNLEGDEGPTPSFNLGKRNRTERSPPSLGSIQGPTQRLFCQSNRSESVPLDLNNPIGASSGNVEIIEGSKGNAADPLGNCGPAGLVNGSSPVPVASDTRAESDLQKRIWEEVEATAQEAC
ncbi:putative RNA recognition motif domain, nucleotide-binding alpha-beta plait domain superfamily [Helianthus annuus]|nr:putative RNA recognition motif domain, nucleotide-binding alpha-beta plait domain superfamily [Helianthus annuus]